ncbi:hypothetical protein [Roseospira goensis]|uniref:BrnT family toxin n=1 Tax=Roseospira goensis TaxID=391922 RepID=A0A7W6WKL1_9PROT|nr:hypothetical protein [Roseospira goensis]MBB4286200.1 hypothetical protein [Roseospira goensis]
MRRGASETYGRDHIDAGKAERIQRARYASVEDFVFDVAQNYDTVWEQKNGRLLLSKTGGGYDSTASIELERGRDGAYYAVITAMPVRQAKKWFMTENRGGADNGTV